ncbi:histidine phosphatase family protein [Sporosarcina sp. G11-34]|uniref:histidine phosphatase family protein n=1 Tax=Sporosarcina sp. G11-34 TaxID=2849605 RepID=UPI0022A9B04A|nr:histidine phosphatase family protein [Sporosarcina sp. G11-34]MCZ2257501.1 histidine phosphatase family protein [Sporosarcina sp. G11-34]
MDRPFIIHLMRHLPTAGNQEKKYIGWTDEPILETAEQSWELPNLPPIIRGSDLLRSKQSAAIYFPHAEFVADSRWRECNFGVFEGKTYNNLEKNMGYRKWLEDPYINPPHNGESLAEVEKRVLAALKSLPNGSVVITHGGPIRVLLTKFSKELVDFWSWKVPHGTKCRLEWENLKAFEEGEPCTSISVAHRMENENT